MIQTTLRTYLLALLLLGCSVSAQAGPMGYDFSYEFISGDVLSGMLTGELQSDLDTVLVSSIEMVAFTGFPSVDFILGPFINVATISGTGMSFGTSFAGSSNEGTFGLSDSSPVFTDGVAIAIGPIGSPIRLEAYAAQSWTLTARNPTPTPVPSTLILFGLAIAGLSWLRRNMRILTPGKDAIGLT